MRLTGPLALGFLTGQAVSWGVRLIGARLEAATQTPLVPCPAINLHISSVLLALLASGVLASGLAALTTRYRLCVPQEFSAPA
jgi:hypothetical protein